MACILCEGAGVYMNNKGRLEFCDCENEEEIAKEKELRQLLHNTIDVMTYEQCQKVAKLLNFSNEFEKENENENTIIVR